MYAGDDPINNADPSGMCWTGLCWASHAAHATLHAVEKYGSGCVSGALAGAAYGALTGPQDAVLGGVAGCGTEIAAEYTENHVPGDRGRALALAIRVGAGLYASKDAAERVACVFYRKCGE